MSDDTPAKTADTIAADTGAANTGAADTTSQDTAGKGPEQKPGEIGGPKGPEPTRYGDWEFKGRCSDF